MAIPTTFAQIHAPTELLLRRVVGGLSQHPFELTEIGADHRRHDIGTRRRFDEGQHTLGDDGEEEEEYACHQSHEAGAEVHSAGPPAGSGAAPGVGTGSLASAGRVSAVIIILMTSRVMPISMLTPDSVRTSQ